MKLTYIRSLGDHENQVVTLKGWVANKRTGKGLVFLVLRDGSGFAQCVIDESKVSAADFETASGLGLESSLELKGHVVKDDRQIGGYELQVNELAVYQIAEDYPISKKEHGIEFLMDHRHLWLRSSKQWAAMRIRNTIIFSIHKFFQERDFMQMDAPIFTSNACEGTTTLFETDFFGSKAYLSQSGQLYGEAMAMAHGKIYTFGNTFRAEKSKTRRHAAEFWMIEPEMAFYNLDMNMDLIEDFLRFIVREVIANCKNELEILERDVEMLQKSDQQFPRMSYDEAVSILKGEKDVNGRNSITVLKEDLQNVKDQIAQNEAEIAEKEAEIAKGGMKKGKVNFYQNRIDKLIAGNRELQEQAGNIPLWLASAINFEHGNDFGGSDETVLTRLFECPIMVYNWPKDIKAFYMKRDEKDDRYVKGVDVLAPEGYGEIVGGAEREDDLEILKQRIIDHELPMSEFEWYLDLRRFGSVPHAGFGLGLERIVMWIAGLQHIREAIPFPRFYGRLTP